MTADGNSRLTEEISEEGRKYYKEKDQKGGDILFLIFLDLMILFPWIPSGKSTSSKKEKAKDWEEKVC